MTELEAEEIIMAVEVGMFWGKRSEYAEALLIIANRKEQEDSDEGVFR